MPENVDVVLVDSGRSPIDVILALQAVSGSESVVEPMDIEAASALVDAAPCVVVPGVPADAGERVKTSLEEAGATVELKPVDQEEPGA